MNRLIALNSVPMADADVAPGTGTPQGATDGNPGTGTPATEFPAYAWNMVQEELYGMVVTAGLTPSSVDYSQVQKAIQSGALNYALAGGTANAITAAFTPAITAYNLKSVYWIGISATNTGAVTINGGGGVVPAKALDGTALRAGDLVAGQTLPFVWDGTNLRCVSVLGGRISYAIQDNCATAGGGITIDAGGNVHIVGATSAFNVISSTVGAGGNIANLEGSSPAYTAAFHDSNNTLNSANGAASLVLIGKDGGTGRSGNVGGTWNTGGADYADYETKDADCGEIAKGAVVGFTIEGLVTDKWSKAVTFGIKSTDPSFVGGDRWGSTDMVPRAPAPPVPPAVPFRGLEEKDEDWTARRAQYEAKVKAQDDAHALAMEEHKAAVAGHAAKNEVLRAPVDRIAKAGKVHCIASGNPKAGDYIVAAHGKGDSIVGISVAQPTEDQRPNRVARVKVGNPSGKIIDRLIAQEVKRNPAWNAIVEVMQS